MSELPQDGRDVINLSNGSKVLQNNNNDDDSNSNNNDKKVKHLFFFRPWVSWFLLRGLRGRMKCEGKVALQNKISSEAHFKWGVITNVTHNDIHSHYLLLHGTHPRKRILMLRPCQKSVSSVYATAIADRLWHVVSFYGVSYFGGANFKHYSIPR